MTCFWGGSYKYSRVLHHSFWPFTWYQLLSIWCLSRNISYNKWMINQMMMKNQLIMKNITFRTAWSWELLLFKTSKKNLTIPLSSLTAKDDRMLVNQITMILINNFQRVIEFGHLWKKQKDLTLRGLRQSRRRIVKRLVVEQIYLFQKSRKMRQEEQRS